MNTQTIKISELDSAISIDGTETLPIVQSGNTKKVTISKLLEEVNSDITSILSGEVYSTSEVTTNKVWVDNKPIYRKAFTGTTNSGETTNITVVDFGDLVGCGGFVEYINGGYTYQIPLNTAYNVNVVNDFRLVKQSATRLFLQCGTNARSQKYKIWVEYTKTTD